MVISRKPPAARGPAGTFTGGVRADPVTGGLPPSRLNVAAVHFAPGAGTAWHCHDGGQTLYGTEGRGLVQVRGQEVVELDPGDVVFAPDGEEHWHGASPAHFMTHLSGPGTGRDWALDDEAAGPVFRQAVELGITFWDTANAYGAGSSEQITGAAIGKYASRDQVVLATKLFAPMGEGPGGRGLSRRAVFEQADASLRRLGTDYIDLYQIHRFDPETPVEETLEALHDVVKAGKARYIGASSMWAWQFSKMQYTAQLHGWTRFVSMQDQYSLIAWPSWHRGIRLVVRGSGVDRRECRSVQIRDSEAGRRQPGGPAAVVGVACQGTARHQGTGDLFNTGRCHCDELRF